MPRIDLSNWSVTTPAGNATKVKPPEILDYANCDALKEFMYDDPADGSLVFYAYPSCCTPNSCYSRTELREQMVAGCNATNWTLARGGRMKATLKMDSISKDITGKPHRAIVLQIHGRLTDAQRELIGQCDNNAPPMLKVYWHNGRVRVKTKVLENLNSTNMEISRACAWGDDAGFSFTQAVGYERFTVEIVASHDRMEVILNASERVVYSNIHTRKWGVFENYFKAGNYLTTTDARAFSRVKFYSLEVTH